MNERIRLLCGVPEGGSTTLGPCSREDPETGASSRRGLIRPELSLDAVLLRIVELVVDPTGARYGAWGVLRPTDG